jgi:polyhydroxyalkanoate synthesis repressor PhaR
MMSVPPSSQQVEIRKYPNRRYYDVTHRRHLCLEDIRTLVCEGFEIRVTESKSGEDITAKVLTQVILELDSPKLEAFPVGLLHQVIRANEPLVRDFIEKYFNQAFAAFVRSQEQFDQYLRQAMGLYSDPAQAGRNWARMMMGPFFYPFLLNEKAAVPPGNRDGAAAEEEDLRDAVERLRFQLDVLQQKLSER